MTSRLIAATVPKYREGVIGNYEQHIDTSRNRPGDNGNKFTLNNLNSTMQSKMEDLKNEYGINMLASSYIPMDRIVPDIRHPECKYWHYSKQLPSTSVVIVFHNEGLTTLMRTVHSVLLRSPRKLVKEIILLDDCSNKEDLRAPLEQYISEHFGDFVQQDDQSYDNETENLPEKLGEKSQKVRLIRNDERQGLIRSRSRGATSATGDVVLFLDAHCEVNYDWLPPLLAPIAMNRRTLTVPVIDGIDADTFDYKPVYAHNNEHYRGIWEWGLLYKEIAVDMQKHLETHKVSEPYDSPTHAGGLFAIDREFFNELGLYDPGLLVWGGENFELSFKVWQCGGRLQWVPCSRVGHIYRPFMPYTFGSLANQRKGPLVLTNYKRVVEVWFDPSYKEYFYTREPMARFYDAGDTSEQLNLKEKLKCKSFDWFMTNVASDVFKDFPKLPANDHWGEIRVQGTNQCLDTITGHPPHNVKIRNCHSQGGNQLFRLNKAGQLATGERCIDKQNGSIMIVVCRLGKVDGPWKMQNDLLTYKKANGKKMCLSATGDDVKLKSCQDSEVGHWEWRELKA